MAVTIDFQPREVCARCRRPVRVCYCAHLPRLETRTRVVVLQHPRERDVPIGTARMASLCLPMSDLHVGVRVADDPALLASLSDPERPAILLYPGEGAIDIVANPPRGPVTLVVVDGTWSQARKIVRNDPVLARLPRYALSPTAPSNYRIRREPSAECVSTIEALADVLGALEGDAARFREMLAPFRAMVDVQVEHARVLHRSRHLHSRRAWPKPPPPSPVPAILRDRENDLVCVVGEANAWPYSSPDRGQFREELVHWVALRVATGELLDVVLAPTHPLAPGTSRWVELEPNVIHDGVSIADLATAWSRFVRPTDVIVSWGRYATRMFAGLGITLPTARVDMRQVARTWSRGKVGTMEEFVAAHASEDAHAPVATIARGRGGRRATELARITHWLITQRAPRDAAASP